MVMGVLFLPARRANHWQAWALLAGFGASGLAIPVYRMKKDPKLWVPRMYRGPTAEKETSQSTIVCIAATGFVALFLGPALDQGS